MVSAASKGVVALLAALLPAAIVLALAIVFLGATVASPSLTLLTLACAALAASAFGALAAGLARGTGASALVAVLGLVPMLLMGGLFYPIAYMPTFARAVASALPVTLATDALRGAMLRSSDLWQIAPALLGLIAVAGVCLVGAWLAGRRSH